MRISFSRALQKKRQLKNSLPKNALPNYGMIMHISSHVRFCMGSQDSKFRAKIQITHQLFRLPRNQSFLYAILIVNNTHTFIYCILTYVVPTLALHVIILRMVIKE